MESGLAGEASNMCMSASNVSATALADCATRMPLLGVLIPGLHETCNSKPTFNTTKKQTYEALKEKRTANIDCTQRITYCWVGRCGGRAVCGLTPSLSVRGVLNTKSYMSSLYMLSPLRKTRLTTSRLRGILFFSRQSCKS